jgi:hypothetical protein
VDRASDREEIENTMSRHRRHHHRRHHHRWGRDSLTGGAQHSWLAALGGFLIVPTVAGLAAGTVAKSMNQTPQAAAKTFAGVHLAGLGGAWWAAKKYPKVHSFLRGGMWGEGVTSVLAVSSAAAIVNIPTPVPGQALTSAAPATSTDQLRSLASKLITAGFIRS